VINQFSLVFNVLEEIEDEKQEKIVGSFYNSLMKLNISKRTLDGELHIKVIRIGMIVFGIRIWSTTISIVCW
jgi:hypothetical protein